MVYCGRKGGSSRGQRGAAVGGPAASMRQAVRAPGAGSPSRSRRSPGRRALRPPRSARPGGAELWPRSADTRGSVNAMTSLLVSAAQQETLSASPFPARRKWGSLLKRSLYSAGPDLVSGPPRGSALPATRFGSAGAGRRGAGTARRMRLLLQRLTWPRLPGDVTVLNRPGCHWPWGDHITCIIERTPGQVGQKPWRAPETGANSAE